MEKAEAIERLKRAISGSKFRWRTPRGIARDSGVPLPQAVELLDRSDAFLRSRKPSNSGEPLYTTKEKHKAQSSLGQRMLNALVNDNAE